MSSSTCLKECSAMLAGQRILRRKIEHQKPPTKRVFLTFDDGPDKRFTPKILDQLKRFNAKATFFVVGKRVRQYPDILKRIVNEGHDIGNHTFTHPVSPILKYSLMEKEIKATEYIIHKITGRIPKLFRPTWLSWDFHARKMNQVPRKLGYYSLRWSISSMDWLGMKKVIKHKIFNAKIDSREVLLFHDASEKSFFPSRKATVDVLPEILEIFRCKSINLLKLSAFIPNIVR